MSVEYSVIAGHLYHTSCPKARTTPGGGGRKTVRSQRLQRIGETVSSGLTVAVGACMSAPAWRERGLQAPIISREATDSWGLLQEGRDCSSAWAPYWCVYSSKTVIYIYGIKLERSREQKELEWGVQNNYDKKCYGSVWNHFKWGDKGHTIPVLYRYLNSPGINKMNAFNFS